MKRFESNRERVAFIALFIVVTVLLVLAAPTVMLTASDWKARGVELSRIEAEYVALAGVSEAVTRLANGEIHDPDGGNPDWRAEIYVGVRKESSPPTFRYMSHQSELCYGTSRNPVTVRYLLDRGRIVYFDPRERVKTTTPGYYPVYVVEAVGRKDRFASRSKGEYISYPFYPRLKEGFICGRRTGPISNDGVCSREHAWALPSLTRPPDCARYHVLGTGSPPVVLGQAGSLNEILGISPGELASILETGSVNRTLEGNPGGITFVSENVRLSKGVSGSGLLYIKGSLEVKGDFHFRGLVYVEGDASFAGDVWVLGGLVVMGSCSANPTVLYSRETIVESMRNHILVELSRGLP
ncbi:MAG: hypothetical protein ACE5JA_06145 [bacterium]